MSDESRISHQIVSIGDFDGGKVFNVSIRIPMELGWIEHVKFSIMKGLEGTAFQMKHLKNEDGFAYFNVVVKLETRAIYHYCFSFESNGLHQFYKKIQKTGNTSITLEECWKMSVNFNVPDWAKGKIMYHIFVDRYRRGSKDEMVPMVRRTIHKSWEDKVVLGPDENGNWNVDFFGGDLKGIEETLKYLKSFGVSIIYLSPICRSQSNHRYDTGDYNEIDPYVGCDEGLRSLCEKAHHKGMKVILDAVFNHTGNDSKYFNQYGTYQTVGAYQSDDSEYAAFYYKPYWENGKKKFPSWWGFDNLPRCNGDSPKWQEFIFGVGGVIDNWCSLGIDGIRADVIDELNNHFIEGMWNALHRNLNDEFLFIGEAWEEIMSANRGNIISGKGMQTTMNYLFVDSVIRYFKYADVDKFKNIVSNIFINYPTDTILTAMNFTSTHDISRPSEIFSCDEFELYGKWSWDLLCDLLERRHVISQDEKLDWIRNHKLSNLQYKNGRRMYEAYVFTLTFWPGIFSIFYGDEVGIEGIGNIANRAPYPWKKRDKKLMKFFRIMGKIRTREKFMETADTKVLMIDSQKLIFERYDNKNRIIVAVNRTQDEIEWSLPERYDNVEIVYSLNRSTDEKLEPFGGIAIRVNK